MFNKVSKEDRIIRGSEADKLLNNSLFSGAVLAVKASIMFTIENSRWRERGLREESYRQLKSLNSVISILEKEVQTGNLARQQLNRESKD